MTESATSETTGDGAKPRKRKPEKGAAAFPVPCRFELHLPSAKGLKPPFPLIVAFHGMSQTAEIFAAQISGLLDGPFAVLVPDGPYAHEVKDGDGRREGRAWYIYTGDQDDFLASVRHTASWVWSLVDAAAARHPIDPARIGLLGYSQGGYLAGVMAIDKVRPVKACVLVGSRLKVELLENGGKKAKKKTSKAKTKSVAVPPFLCLHGERDKIVPTEIAKQSADKAKDLGVEIRFETFPAGHRVVDEEMRAAAAFFLNRL